MKKLVGACIVGQSGGPTAVINSSVYGVIRTALDAPEITRVFGAANGIKGVLDDKLYDMGAEDAQELELLLHTPSSVLGSCRYKIADPDEDDTDYRRILEIFKKYDVRYFFYNGGNDSMDTCNKVSKYMKSVGYDCNIIGVPKTVDNDLAVTDHCPGYPSAAKYIATTLMELYLDARVYDTGMVTIVEIMGRNAGWLTAAAKLACHKGMGPDLIYVPEAKFDLEKFLKDVSAVYNREKKCIVAVSEGVRDKDGMFISEYSAKDADKDAFGHAQMGGLAAYLAAVIKEVLGTKVRGIELSLLQRCAAHLASQTDIDEAFAVGKTAVQSAIEGATDAMVAIIRREDGPYSAEYRLVPLENVANFEKKLPLEWISADGSGITDAFLDYALPLVQGKMEFPTQDSLPRFARLKKKPVSV